MFIDIWDTENKAIKINKFSKDLISSDDKKYNNAVNKILKDYGILIDEGIVYTEYYFIHFYNKEDNYLWSNYMLYFTNLFDCFKFLNSPCFEYLFENESLNFIKIQAGNKIMFKYDDRG